MAGLGEHFLVWFDNLELKVIGPTKDLSETCASSLKTGVHFAHRSESDVPAGILTLSEYQRVHSEGGQTKN
jgi:hypothetical protein